MKTLEGKVPLINGASGVLFEGLVLTESRSLATRRGAPWAVSFVVHTLLIASAVVVPLFFYESLPAPDGGGIRAFMVTPELAAPPPPPPPPPALGVRAIARPTVARRPEAPARFVAPIETPTKLEAQEGLSLGVGGEPEEGLGVEGGLPGGVEGGVPGGVEGGVPGGVVGGVVGGMPREPPPPPKVVRVGSLNAPKLVRKVNPAYPELARETRLSAFIILEVTVDTNGRVRDVTVLRGQPIFDDAAIAAVRQWIYQPLLQNGVPTEFVVSVTLSFKSAPSRTGRDVLQEDNVSRRG